jgi:ABC-2 type transport system ATP-binding protein
VSDLLDHVRHRLELRFAQPVPRDLFQGVPGVIGHEIDGNTVVITLDGPVGPAMRAAASQPGLLRVSPAGDELEDLFLKLYEGGTQGPDA